MEKALKILAVLMYAFLPSANAQQFPDIKFSPLNTINEPLGNQVTTVFKDSRGLIWLGTEEKGLLRYDGKKIKSYYNAENNTGKIAANYIGTICEDKQGWLWISTTEGLYHIDPVTETIEWYQHNDRDKGSVATNEKPIPFIDSKGRLWITSNKGFQQFDTTTKKFINYFIPPISNPSWQFNTNQTIAMLEDSRQRLWVGSAYGLYLVDTLSHTLSPRLSGFYAFVANIYEDPIQQIWVSFWGKGLRKFIPETGQFLSTGDDNSFVTSVGAWKDNNEKNWMYFIRDNIFTLHDPVTGKNKYYQQDISKARSFYGTPYGTVYHDNENRLWIPGNKGVNIIDNKLQQFSCVELYNDIQKGNNNRAGDLKDLLVTKDEYVISAWEVGLLYRFNKNWEIKNKPSGIFYNLSQPARYPIHSIQQGDQGYTWYGTDSGLVKQSSDKYHYKVYLPADTFLSVDYKYSARDILKRTDEMFWVRFPGRGIYLFDPAKEKFLKKYSIKNSGIIQCMEYDKKQKLWVGTANGLYQFDPVVDSFIRFPIQNSNQPTTKLYNNVYQLQFDKDNIGWLATFNGLVKLDTRAGKTNFITDPVNPVNHRAYRILQDSSGIIWILSTENLIAYNKKNGSFRYFTSDHGLPEDFSGFPGILKFINDSTIAVSNIGTIITFNPYRIMQAGTTSPLLFTDVAINGKRYIPKDNLLTVPSNASIIYVHFSLLNYTASRQNKLYYRIASNKNSEWIASPDGDITLYDLPAGKYQLEIKGTNNDETTNQPVQQLTIVVKPRWYQTTIFLTACIIAFLLGVYILAQWRLKSAKNKIAIRQQITETEMAALKAQMNPHFMFNCINSIDAFIHSNDKYNATLYLNKFAKLLRNVLDSSKENTVSLSKDLETLKLYTQLEELRNENKFKTIFTIDENLLRDDCRVPPLIIQPFVENAILHGLRNRPGNYGLLQIDIKRTGDTIEYTITDNGIGRKAAGKIPSNKEKSYGLQMSYDRIRLFNKEEKASVQISDLAGHNEAAGTRVSVKLNLL